MVVDATGEINYFLSTTDGCLPRLSPPTTVPWPTTNITTTPVRVTFCDIRDNEIATSLDTNGFEIVRYPGFLQTEFEGGTEIQRNHYEEMIEILKKHLEASHIIIYHHAFRARNTSYTMEQINVNHKNPLFYPHVDVNSDAVQKIIEQLTGREEATKLMKKRYQVINIWRPIGQNPIINTPLAICDYQTVDLKHDVHPLITGDSVNKATAYVLSRNNHDTHKWYYVSHMTSNEMFLMKMFDSDSTVARFAFHTAFINESELPSNIEQKSIEIRFLVFYN